MNVVKQVHAFEWIVAEEHVEKNYSQGPDVYLLVVRFAGEDLWCHEVRGTTVRFGSLLNGFTEAEVANLAGEPLIFGPLFQQDIFALDVPMNDICLMNVVYSFQNFHKYS